MSRGNVEVVRRGLEAWNAGDMATLRETYDPAVVMYHLEGWPEPGPSIGREAVMRQWEKQREIWDIDTVEPVSDFIEAGNRVVLRFGWRGSGSGPEMELEMTAVQTLRKGKIIVIEWFWDHDEALEAVGLSE